MAPRKSKGNEEVAREILSYFLRNPRAVDSFEGVARWRLLDERIHRSLEETKQALWWLVTQGFLVEESTPLAGQIFRLNQKKRADATRFLMSPEGSGD